MSLTSKPLISVLMPVYNSESTVRQAIESILNQSFCDFELVIIDDCSTDRTKEIILSFNDQRIKFIENSENLKLAACLNKGMKAAQGKYIARMDGDDISLKHRLKKQLNFLEKNPEISLCGSWIKHFGDSQVLQTYPLSDEEIKIQLLFNSALAHPSVMFRREIFIEKNLFYAEDFPVAQDYELWVRGMDVIKFSNLKEILLLYRSHKKQHTKLIEETKNQKTARIKSILLNKLNVFPTKEELELHNLISDRKYIYDEKFLIHVQNWLEKLVEHNRSSKVFNHECFKKYLAQTWLTACKDMAKYGLDTLPVYNKSVLGGYNKLSLTDYAKYCSIILAGKSGFYKRKNNG